MITELLASSSRLNIQIYQNTDFSLDLRVMNPTGTLYDSGAVYYTDDVVHKSDGTIWVALQDGFSGQAPVAGAYWSSVAATWDLSGMTFSGKIRTGVGEADPVMATFTSSVTSATGGRVSFTLTDTITNGIARGTYSYDIIYTEAGGNKGCLCYGTATVIGAVTTA